MRKRMKKENAKGKNRLAKATQRKSAQKREKNGDKKGERRA